MADRKVRQLPTGQEIQDALSRVLRSSVFARSERARELLEYVVTQEQDGKGNLLKGFSIAQDVFGKDDDFDPSTDAVVRVQAGRLREILTTYYQSEGQADPVEIIVPRGTYVPTYAYRDVSEAKLDKATETSGSRSDSAFAEETLSFGKPTSKLDLNDETVAVAVASDYDAGSVDPQAKSSPLVEKTAKRILWAVIGLLLLLAAILYLLLANSFNNRPVSAPLPRALVAPPISPDLPTVSIAFEGVGQDDWLHKIQNAVFRFSTIRLIAAEGVAQDQVQAEFSLRVQPRSDDTADVTLVQSSSSNVVWSGNIVNTDEQNTASNFTLSGALTHMFTASGKLFSHLAESQELAGLPECLHATNAYFTAQNAERYRTAYDCHETLLQAENVSPLVYADMTSLMVERVLEKTSYPETLTPEETFLMAQRGLEAGVLPEHYRALAYYFAYRGDTQATETASQNAYRLNPFNLEFAASYAFALERAWAYDYAQDLIEMAIDGAVITPYWWYYSWFVSAYANNDMQAASLAARGLAGSSRSEYIAARLIIASFNENLILKDRLLAELTALDTVFTRDPRAAYNNVQSPGIAARLTQSLISTGFAVPAQ